MINSLEIKVHAAKIHIFKITNIQYRSNNLQYCTKTPFTGAKHAILQPLSLSKQPQGLKSKGSFFKHKTKRKKITRQTKSGHNS